LVTAKVRSFRLQDADTLDAIQMTWLRLAESYHQIKRPECLGSWLATTAARESLHIVRRDKRATPGLPEAMAQMADPSGGPEDQAVRADIVRVVRDLIDRLTPERRELLSSLFAEDRPSYADLSRRSGIPIGSIGPTRARTLAHLKLVLEK
jgi:RNA polymerase sigma factor (sigma-70 family)